MMEHNPPPSADDTRPPVIPLPIALYVSGELIFELYDGGHPSRRFSIRWERFVPTKKTSQRRPKGVPPRPCAHTKIRSPRSRINT